jgi:YHS domain-containing protein
LIVLFAFAFNDLLDLTEQSVPCIDHGEEVSVFGRSSCKPLAVSAILCFAVILSYSGPSPAAAAEDNTVYGVAIEGYDPVAYFTEEKPVKGSAEHFFDWNDARWYFSSAENRALFAADPKKYAPSHAGFCAVSFSAGKFAGMDPLRWKIVDGRLFLGWVKTEDDNYYQHVEKFLQALTQTEKKE